MTTPAMRDYNEAVGRTRDILREAAQLDLQGHHDLAELKRQEARNPPVQNRAAKASYQKNAVRFEERRKHRAEEARGGYGPGARVSAEQDLNWGGAASAPRPKAEFKGAPQGYRPPSEWGARPTGIALNAQEKMGAHSDFRFAGAYEIPFTRFKGKTMLATAATYDGLSTLHWMATKAKIKSENLKRALEKFLKDPRCAAALEECSKAAMRGKA